MHFKCVNRFITLNSTCGWYIYQYEHFIRVLVYAFHLNVKKRRKENNLMVKVYRIWNQWMQTYQSNHTAQWDENSISYPRWKPIYMIHCSSSIIRLCLTRVQLYKAIDFIDNSLAFIFIFIFVLRFNIFFLCHTGPQYIVHCTGKYIFTRFMKS